MKIVLDTDIILSDFITQGLSSRVIDICIDKHQLFISQWIVNEVIEKLNTKFKTPKKELKRVKDLLLTAFRFIQPEGEIPDLCKDKDDNNILYLAQYIDADLIITGDKDLLELKIIKKSMIINPRTFMEKYHNMH
jgi:putative PIN family toxin of toxin-antitoxin system